MDFLCECAHVCIHMGLCMPQHDWRLEDNFQLSVPSFYHVGPGDKTQVTKRP